MEDLKKIIERLDELGTKLYKDLGSRSYTHRCVLHDIKADLSKIDFISSSLLLKDRYTSEFEEWLQYQQKDIKFDKYILNDTYLTKEQMFEYWESDKNNL